MAIKTDEQAELLLEKELAQFNKVILAQSLSWLKKFLSEVRGITMFTTTNNRSKKEFTEKLNYYTDWAQRILAKGKSMYKN